MDYKNSTLKVSGAEINTQILTADLNMVSKEENIETNIDISKIQFEVIRNNYID